jgi:hypothetical protein
VHCWLHTCHGAVYYKAIARLRDYKRARTSCSTFIDNVGVSHDLGTVLVKIRLMQVLRLAYHTIIFMCLYYLFRIVTSDLEFDFFYLFICIFVINYQLHLIYLCLVGLLFCSIIAFDHAVITNMDLLYRLHTIR